MNTRPTAVNRTQSAVVVRPYSDMLGGWIPAALLLIVTLAAFAPSVRAGFIWDDDGYVENNEALRTPGGLADIWKPGTTQDYYPLTFTTFWVEWQIWQNRPAGYHVTNILLHALNAILLWRLLLRLEVPGALLAALLFAVHPVHVESVTWVTERKNVLSGAWSLLSLHAFVRFDHLDHETLAEGGRRWWLYMLSMGAFLLAMLSKTAVVPLPLLLPVLAWWKRGRLAKRDFLQVLPFYLVIAPLFVVASLKDANFAGAGVAIFGDAGPEWQLSLSQRVLLCGRVLWFYAGKMLWPHPLIFVYPRWDVHTSVWWQYLFPIAAIGLLIGLWLLRGRLGRGPLATALIFGLMLAPASGFFNFYFQRYSYVADHLQYLASLGPTILFAAIAAKLAIRWSWPWSAKVAVSGLLLAALCILSWRQQSAYRNRESLWADTLKKNPDCWMAHNNLGTALVRLGQPQEAILHYRQSLRIKLDNAEAHNNWGIALDHMGLSQEAMLHYQEALRINPDYAEAHNNWGTALSNLGRPEEAIPHYEAALRINPDYADAHNNWGNAMIQLGRPQEAVPHYQQALRVKPDFALAHNNLGTALDDLGHPQEAISHYQEALRIVPDYAQAHYNWGNALDHLGRPQEAISHYQEALRIKPDFARAHYNWGNALTALGRPQEAISHYQEALRLKRDYVEAHINWGSILMEQGLPREAAGHFVEALRLRPNCIEALDSLRSVQKLLEQPESNGPPTTP